MEVLITGISGFVGKNLSTYLNQRDIQVEGMSLRNELWKNQLNKKSDAIIHLAGKAHDTNNTTQEQEYFLINRDLTISLFDEFLKSDIKDFFFFSSVKSVVDTIDVVLTEEINENPKTPYGKSKFEAEQYLLSQKLPIGKRLFIIRPCMIHGHGNKGNLNMLYKIVKNGIPWPLSRFENRRSYLSIDNLSYLVFEMINCSNINSGIYNFADDESLSTNKLIKIINAVLRKKNRFLPISKKIVVGIAKIGDIVHLPLNSERLKKLTENYEVSNAKIKEALKINKLPLSAEEGLIKTFQSFKTK